MHGLRMQFNRILKDKNREIFNKKNWWRGRYKRSSGSWGIGSIGHGFGRLFRCRVWKLDRKGIFFEDIRRWLLIHTEAIWFKETELIFVCLWGW